MRVKFLILVVALVFISMAVGQDKKVKTQVFIIDPGVEELGVTIKLISKANDSLRITSKDLGEWMKKSSYDSLMNVFREAKRANDNLALHIAKQTVDNLNIVNPALARLAQGDTTIVVITRSEYNGLVGDNKKNQNKKKGK